MPYNKENIASTNLSPSLFDPFHAGAPGMSVYGQ